MSESNARATDQIVVFVVFVVFFVIKFSMPCQQSQALCTLIVLIFHNLNLVMLPFLRN